MRYLSLFSGIEACSVAWEPLGWEPVAFAEIDPFPCAVLAQRFPGVPNLGSVTDITDEQIRALGHIDLVVGGSPCQDLSVLGKRRGLAGERSGLFHEQMRIFHAARTLCGARFLLWENVPGAFSSHGGRDFGVVVGTMAGCDVGVPLGGWGSCGAAIGANGLLEWRVLDAQFVRVESHPSAVPQRRRRVFALLDSGEWRDRPPILLERDGLLGNPPPSREAGQGVAGSVTQSIDRGGVNSEGGDNHLIAHTNAVGRLGDVSATLQSAVGGNGNAGNGSEMIGAHTLRAEHDASEDGRGVPLVPSQGWPADVASTLDAHYGDKMGLENQHALNGASLFVQSPAIAFHPTQDPINSEEVCHALSQGNGKGHASAAVAIRTANTSANGHGVAEEVAHTLCADHNSIPAVLQQSMQVRRLTPLECERLQGFPDGWTNIIYRGKPASDGPRYKALGNSMAVNCMRWIGERIGSAELVEFAVDREAA